MYLLRLKELRHEFVRYTIILKQHYFSSQLEYILISQKGDLSV